MGITIRSVTKRFGEFVALDGVSLEVPAGSLLALLGPSGSGKTTLLRIIAGLELPDSGAVFCQGQDVTRRAPRERGVGFVFQHYALFRHLTVFENVAFGLRVRHRPDAQVQKRVGELLRLVRLEGLEDRLPAQLSGGQRQRVALARALAPSPEVLLLDEPFGALDAKVRQELRGWLRRLHDELHVTSVFVTHDQEEAFEVADQVVVLGKGRVEQTGTPEEVFEHPANEFVMDFLGNVNVFHGRVQNGQAILGDALVDCPEYGGDVPRPAALYVRPHELEIECHANGTPAFPARVLHVNPAGSVVRVQLLAPEFGGLIQAEVSPERHAALRLRAGLTVYVALKRVRAFIPEYTI